MVNFFLAGLSSSLDKWGWIGGTNSQSKTYTSTEYQLRSQLEKKNDRWFPAQEVWFANDGKTLQAFSGRCGCIPWAAKWKFQPIQEIRATAGIYTHVCVCMRARASILRRERSILLIVLEKCHLKLQNL